MNIIYDAVGYFSVRGLLMGAGLGALYGTLLFPFLGTMLGAVLGGIVGLGAGIGCGVLAGLLTRGFFSPPEAPLLFKRLLSLICAIFTFFAADFGFSLLLSKNFFSGFFPPTLIAAGAAIYVTLGFVDRYVSDGFEKSKRKHEEISRENARFSLWV